MFAAIERDGGNELAVVEAVGIDRRFRKQGVGRALFAGTIARAHERGCHLVQLTSDKCRPNVRRFDACLGIVASHEGMKLQLRCARGTAPAAARPLAMRCPLNDTLARPER